MNAHELANTELSNATPTLARRWRVLRQHMGERSSIKWTRLQDLAVAGDINDFRQSVFELITQQALPVTPAWFANERKWFTMTSQAELESTLVHVTTRIEIFEYLQRAFDEMSFVDEARMVDLKAPLTGFEGNVDVNTTTKLQERVWRIVKRRTDKDDPVSWRVLAKEIADLCGLRRTIFELCCYAHRPIAAIWDNGERAYYTMTTEAELEEARLWLSERLSMYRQMLTAYQAMSFDPVIASESVTAAG